VKASTRCQLIAGALAVLVAASLLAVGHHYTWWAPDPPHDANALVLRIRFSEGMTASIGDPVPAISVYGDGRVLTTAADLTRSPPRSFVKDQRLTRAAYRRVYRDAHLAGLTKSRTFSEDETTFDAGPTRVTLLAGGRRQESTVAPGAGGPRVWLIERLAEHLRSLPRGDLSRPWGSYRPARLAIISALAPESASEGPTPVPPWPLGPLGPPSAGRRAACVVVTGADADAAARLVGSAPWERQWRHGPTRYQVRIRPMLPDEKDCAAVTR
jgi:hypothetical protein